MLKTAALGILLIAANACNNIPSAAELKNGKFFYYSKKHRRKITIVRKDSTHTETEPASGRSMTFDIKWKDDSAYFTKARLKPETPVLDSDKIAVPVVFSRKIILITPGYYVVIPTHNENSFFAEIKDTVWIEKLYR